LTDCGDTFGLMKTFSRRPATYDDLRALPEGQLGQILQGELLVSPRPTLEHQRSASVLGMELGPPFERGRGGPGGWWILDEPEVHLGEDVLVPDLAGWRRERCPEPPAGPYATVAPDWVCEVLSPSTAGIDRVRKMHVYQRENVTHVWLLDPVGRSLEVFRLGRDGWIRVGSFHGADLVRAEPFESIELQLDALWLPSAAPVEE
jgi:Uma2 family endonuclease